MFDVHRFPFHRENRRLLPIVQHRMIGNPSNLQRFSLHGAGVGVTCMVKSLACEIEHLLSDFRVSNWTAGVVPVTGTIWAYEQLHVMRHLSQTAKRVTTNAAGAE